MFLAIREITLSFGQNRAGIVQMLARFVFWRGKLEAPAIRLAIVAETNGWDVSPPNNGRFAHRIIVLIN